MKILVPGSRAAAPAPPDPPSPPEAIVQRRRIPPGSAALLTAAASVLLLAVSEGSRPSAPLPAPPAKKAQLVEAKAPPFSDGIFPCSDCHDGTFNATRRELEFHDEIQKEFHHDSDNRWCLDCHDAVNRDVLHLSNGAPLPFTESYRLCGQCHGDKYRDWRRGVHGKRIGEWNGVKTYLLCVHCHNPHSPRFRPIAPLPPPQRPGEMNR